MNIKKKLHIKLSDPFFFGNELKKLKECVASKWISASGNIVKKFENKIKKITDSKYALATINCTSALQLAIRLQKPSFDDEILVPSITFAATINSVIYNNCKPIFFDCDENLLIDLKSVISFIKKNTYFKNGYSYNKKTKKKILAIIIVHVFGNVVNLNRSFIRLLKLKNITIVEDAAESLGSYLKKKKTIIHSGTLGDIGCLSFNGNKIITSGGGGMMLFKKKKDLNYAKYLSFQAKNDSTKFIHNEIGYNMGMSNLHASIGLSQLEKLNKVLKKKERIHNYYLNEINKIKGLKIIKNPGYSLSNQWLNILEVDSNAYGISKEKIIKKFQKLKIEVRSLWYPNHLQKYCKTYQQFNIKNASLKFKKCLCLPSSYSLSKNFQFKIINLLKNKFNII